MKSPVFSQALTYCILNICAWNLSWKTDTNFTCSPKPPVDNIPDYVEHHDAGEINNGQHFSRYWHFESALNHEYLNLDFDFEFEASPVRIIHLLGSTKLHLRDAYQGIPPQGSYMQKICDRHNISPETAAIPIYKAYPLLTNETKIPA